MKTVTISEKTGEEDDDEAENDEREGEGECEEDEEGKVIFLRCGVVDSAEEAKVIIRSCIRELE